MRYFANVRYGTRPTPKASRGDCGPPTSWPGSVWRSPVSSPSGVFSMAAPIGNMRPSWPWPTPSSVVPPLRSAGRAALPDSPCLWVAFRHQPDRRHRWRNGLLLPSGSCDGRRVAGLREPSAQYASGCLGGGVHDRPALRGTARRCGRAGHRLCNFIVNTIGAVTIIFAVLFYVVRQLTRAEQWADRERQRSGMAYCSISCRPTLPIA